jgi:hypothetical protein
MSKHEIITRNLRTLTGSRTFGAALKGWEVQSVISLPRWRTQAYELCGTRFRKGARIRHERTAATILIGGTCLATIRKRRFPPKFKFKVAKRKTTKFLRGIYGDVVDPGNWLKWVLENGSRRIASQVIDLQCFAALRNQAELDLLIRFHDRKRLFPSAALLPHAGLMETIYGIEVPPYITINLARRLEAKLDRKRESFRVLADYASHVVVPTIFEKPRLRGVWKALNDVERRAVIALIILDKRANSDGEPLCPLETAHDWPTPQRTPMFVLESENWAGIR